MVRGVRHPGHARLAVPGDAAPPGQAPLPLSRASDFVADTFAVGAARSEAARAERGDRAIDRQTVIILLVAALCLNGAAFTTELVPDAWSRLAEMNAWAASQILFYAVIPLLVWRLVLHQRFVDIGLRLRGTTEHWVVYLGFFLLAIPFVLVASTTARFQETYPLWEVHRGDHPFPALWVWWAFYAAQFFAIEVFFRGLLVHGLVPKFGTYSVLIMVLPYTMIHFVKPPAEAMAAIVGGLVMGTLSLRTRSIWWGVALHCSVAALMDLTSLWHKGIIG